MWYYILGAFLLLSTLAVLFFWLALIAAKRKDRNGDEDAIETAPKAIRHHNQNIKQEVISHSREAE